jgi:isopenicillin N synthase-like dioxygenase
MDTDEGEDLEQESEALLDLSRLVFDLPLEEKNKYMMELGGPLAG